MNDVVIVDKDGPVATVRLNRPEQHNAMTPLMIRRIAETFNELSADPDVRVVVLTGTGRSFCAGADLGSMRAASDFTMAENKADAYGIFDMLEAVDSCSKPVLARVNGAAIGGGSGLVCCADIAVAVERAKFGYSEVRLGIVPAVISPYVLAKIGPWHARELFLTGERFDAAAAKRYGMVHHIVADQADLDAKVAERVEALLGAAPGAQAAIKKLIPQVAFQPKDSVREVTAQLITEVRAGPEGKEGMSAFLEKREPWWRA